MITALLRRTLVDLWDNAVACFALNLAVLCVAIALLHATSLATSLAPPIFVAALLAMLAAGLTVMTFAGGLMDQVASRSDIELWKALPDIGFSALATCGLAGISGLAALLLSGNAPTPALAVAQTIGGFWLVAVALQIVVLFPALALERHASATARMTALAVLALRHPVSTLVLALLSALSLAATVGLLPGPAGMAYLFLRTGRLMRAGLNPLRQTEAINEAVRQQAIAAELRPLRNRTPRNLLQPWRAS